MAFEIVDGMTGTKHISSDDLSALNVATIGKADCVLKYGDDFKLTMTNANSATLGTGVGMVGGKRFWNQAATNLTVQSGTQGQKRNDLVVARYAKTSAGIESITPVVIKGTPTTGTAADPEVTANDLKLWRVPLDGISVGEPVKLFEPVASLTTLGDSVSRAVLLLSEDLTVPGGKMRVEVYDMPAIREFVMRVSGNVKSTSKFFNDYYTTGKIPNDKLPSTSVNCALAQYEGTWGRFCARGSILDDGRVRLSLIAPQSIQTGYTSECHISYAF